MARRFGGTRGRERGRCGRGGGASGLELGVHDSNGEKAPDLGPRVAVASKEARSRLIGGCDGRCQPPQDKRGRIVGRGMMALAGPRRGRGMIGGRQARRGIRCGPCQRGI